MIFHFVRRYGLPLAAALIMLATPVLAHEGAPDKAAPTEDTAAPYAAAAATVDAFHAALVKGDRDAALATLAEDVQIYEQGWVERSKAEYASHHLESDMKFSAAVTREQTARRGAISGDIAYVMSESRSTGQFNDKPIDAIAIETMVLRRAGDGWLIAHIHWSNRNAKK